ncbi:MAG: porin family protein [Prevotellaceae bacterium]|jgi:hypothetical protein|nr:porin family protein [Prevotellaceae bacterium]
MKKTILIMLISVLCTGFANAQVYVGGSLGFGTETEKPEVGDKTTTTSFSFAPEVGYSLNSNFELGISLAIVNLKTDFGSSESKSNAWSIAPYARLSVIEFGNFSVWGQANLFVGGGKQNSQKATSFGLNIQPVLKYNLSDHFSLLANLNFLNFGFSQTKIKDVSTTTSFGLGVDSYDVVTLGDISVGFVYKF